jgi:hypothetical protein
MALIAVGASVGTPAPRRAASGNGLQRAHFVEADDRSPLGWGAV